jgi:hypothetical protein
LIQTVITEWDTPAAILADSPLVHSVTPMPDTSVSAIKLKKFVHLKYAINTTAAFAIEMQPLIKNRGIRYKGKVPLKPGTILWAKRIVDLRKDGEFVEVLPDNWVLELAVNVRTDATKKDAIITLVDHQKKIRRWTAWMNDAYNSSNAGYTMRSQLSDYVILHARVVINPEDFVTLQYGAGVWGYHTEHDFALAINKAAQARCLEPSESYRVMNVVRRVVLTSELRPIRLNHCTYGACPRFSGNCDMSMCRGHCTFSSGKTKRFCGEDTHLPALRPGPAAKPPAAKRRRLSAAALAIVPVTSDDSDDEETAVVDLVPPLITALQTPEIKTMLSSLVTSAITEALRDAADGRTNIGGLVARIPGSARGAAVTSGPSPVGAMVVDAVASLNAVIGTLQSRGDDEVLREVRALLPLLRRDLAEVPGRIVSAVDVARPLIAATVADKVIEQMKRK